MITLLVLLPAAVGITVAVVCYRRAKALDPAVFTGTPGASQEQDRLIPWMFGAPAVGIVITIIALVGVGNIADAIEATRTFMAPRVVIVQP